MMAFLSTYRDMGWQSALVFLFSFIAILCMVIVYLLQRFGRDDWGRYVPPEDLQSNRFSVGRDAKTRDWWLS